MNGLYDEFRIAVHNVWQRRWLALAIAWGIAVLGWLIVAMIPNSYESTAKVLVQTQSILNDKIGVTPVEQKAQMDRIEQTLTSATNLEKVVRSTALGQDVASAREMENKVAALRLNIKMVSTQDNVFQISATSAASNLSDAENAKLSQDIVQKLIDIFAEENLAGGRVETSQTLKFLDQQLAKRQKDLELAEQKRVEFETKNLGLLPGVGSVSQRLAAARAELSQIDTQLMAAQGALAAMNGQLAGTPRSIATPGVAGSGGARGALAQARSDLANARASGKTDQHPDVIVIQNQIRALQAQAASEPAGGGGFQTTNPAYSSLQGIAAERQASVSALQARKRALEADLASMTSLQTAEPEVAAEQARINRDYDVLKEQYDKLLADRENVQLRGQVESETDAVRLEVLERPSSPRVPVAPNRPILLVLVLFAGIGGGIGTAFGISQMRTSYPTAARLEKASGLPVIGSISHFLNTAQRAERKQKLKYFAGASAGLAGVFVVLLMIEFVQRGMVA